MAPLLLTNPQLPMVQTPSFPWCIPVLIDGTVHLCLQLVGASADGTAVSTGPQGPRIILEVLQTEGLGECILKTALKNL